MVSTAFLDFFEAFWPSSASSSSSSSPELASYMQNTPVWRSLFSQENSSSTHSPAAGLPPVRMAICGTFSHPHHQSCPCHQSLGGFGRSVAEICRTLDLCSLTWTAAPCAQRPYLSSFHHYKGEGKKRVACLSLRFLCCYYHHNNKTVNTNKLSDRKGLTCWRLQISDLCSCSLYWLHSVWESLLQSHLQSQNLTAGTRPHWGPLISCQRDNSSTDEINWPTCVYMMSTVPSVRSHVAVWLSACHLTNQLQMPPLTFVNN